MTTIRHLNESDYIAFKKEMNDLPAEYKLDIDWKELEKYGLHVIRTDDENEDVRSIYELDITEMYE